MRASGVRHKAGVDGCIYSHYERYCKDLGLTAASQDDYENVMESIFRSPKKYSTPWDQHNLLPVLMWPNEVSKSQKAKTNESKLERKNRTGLNRAFRDVRADPVVEQPRDFFFHQHLLKPQCGLDFKVARQRGHDPNTPFVLEDINQWLRSLVQPGTRPRLMTGQGSFWDGWDCDAWLTQEYGDTYSVFLADERRLLIGRLPWLSTPREKWQADHRSRRIHRKLYAPEFYRWLRKDLLKRILQYAQTFEYTQKAEYTQRFERTVRHGYAWKYEGMQKAEPTRRYIVGLPMTRTVRTRARMQFPEQLYRGSEFADGYQSVRLQYVPDYVIRTVKGAITEAGVRGKYKVAFIRDMSLGFWPDKNVSLSLYQSSAVGRISAPRYCPKPDNDEERERHRFFSACGKRTFPVPASPITTGGFYLRLKKSWRNGGPHPDSARLYFGRVISRNRYPDETDKQWVALSMRHAESFVVDNLRDVEFGSKDWLKWTERYYALKVNPLPLIPDGLDEGTAWERDGDGKYVGQLRTENVFEDYATAMSECENEDVESWTPPETWSGE
jgi:hypothetical protein